MLIYNIHKLMKDYKPRKEGKSPYSIDLYRKIGFKVLAFDKNYTGFVNLKTKILGVEKAWM